MVVVDSAEFVGGALGIAQRVAVELGDVKASLGVALSFVAAEEHGVLAPSQHALERSDRGAWLAEPFLAAGRAGQRVVPERSVRVGVPLSGR